jgi:type I restriction enzyme, S subunit
MEEFQKIKIKYITSLVELGGTPSRSIPSNYSDAEEGIPWVLISDITKSGNYVKNSEEFLSKDGLNEKNLSIFKPNTLLYTINASIGNVSELLINAAISQTTLAIIENKNKIYKDYLKYSLEVLERKEVSFESTQENLPKSKFVNLYIKMPKSLNYQQKIANYLDQETSKIDNSINFKKQQLEVLDSYKKSLIYEYVTGKNSSENRVNYKLGKLITYCQTGPFQGRDNPPGKFPLIGSGQEITTSEIFHYDGEYISIPKATPMFPIYLNEKFAATQNAHITSFNKKLVNTKYIFYYFNGKKDFITETIYKGSALKLTTITRIKTININLPSLEIQQQIVDILDKETSRINELSKVLSEQIEVLTQYKKSLIYECVTGKKEV